MASFSQRLKQLREENNWSVRHLAKLTGISHSAITYYEMGERNPKREALEAIADVFNVDMDYLLGNSDIKNLYQLELQTNGDSIGLLEIGAVIKQYRGETNISLRDFAAKCGTSHSYIAMLESGKNSKTGEPIVPTITMLKKIAHGMDMSVSDLIAVCDDMPVNMQPPEFKLNYFDSTKEDIPANLQLFGNSGQLPEKEKKLLALYNKIEDKEGLLRFIERLAALSEEQQKFVFDNLLQGQ